MVVSLVYFFTGAYVYTVAKKTTNRAPIPCPKCVTNDAGFPTCCARGGSWFQNCGNNGDSNFQHTWDEGFIACISKLAADSI